MHFQRNCKRKYIHQLRKPPLIGSDDFVRLNNHEIQRTTHLGNVFKINLGITSRHGVLPLRSITSNQFDEHLYKLPDLLRQYSFAISRLKSKIITNGIFLTNSWSTNYYHFLYDVTPKLLKAQQDDKYKDLTVFMPERLLQQKFVKEILHYYCINYRVSQPGCLVKNSYYMEDLVETGNISSDVLGLIPRRFSTAPWRRLYCKRDGIRSVENESSLLGLLNDYGFETIDWSKLSFGEQVSIASEAQIMLGSHGANLANMLFMKSGSSLIEIRDKHENHFNCYFNAASTLKVNFCYSEAEKLNSQFTCDIADLKKQIELCVY